MFSVASKVEHAHGNAAYLEVSKTDGAAVGGFHSHHFALVDSFALRGHLAQGARKDPGMKAVQ